MGGWASSGLSWGTIRHSSLPFVSPSSECCTQITGTCSPRAFSTRLPMFATTESRPGAPSTTPFCTSTTRSAVLGRFSSVVMLSPLRLDVEANVQHVAVLDDIRLALEPLLAGARDLGVRAERDEIVPADHLAADEASRDIGADGVGGFDRGLPLAKCPRSGVLLTRTEERNQVQRLDEPAHDLAERGLAAAAELRGLRAGPLGELRLQLQVDSARAVFDRG